MTRANTVLEGLSAQLSIPVSDIVGFTAFQAPMQVVKGFDKPVRNYVVDQMASIPDGDQKSHTLSKRDLQVSLELEAMSAEEHEDAITELEPLLSYFDKEN